MARLTYIGLALTLLIATALLWRVAFPSVPRTVVPADPPGFVSMIVPEGNPLTESGIHLGEKLFADPAFSADGKTSCASCHQPQRAFTDGRPRAVGAYGRVGERNAPSLFNVGYYYRGLFWDGRVATLEDQVLHPLFNPIEVGARWTDLAAYLASRPDYVEAFRRAFGAEATISRKLVARALAQYLRTLVSAGSKFDRVQAGFDSFTDAEQRGWAIFFDATDSLPHAECAHCHSDPLFTNLAFENTGLDPAGSETDLGRMAITGRPIDRGRFRVPSLRNVALTAPYMHDGRFSSLEEVIDHYVSGGKPGANVNPNVRPLMLAARHKADLIAFLHTLTDTAAVISNSGPISQARLTREE